MLSHCQSLANIQAQSRDTKGLRVPGTSWVANSYESHECIDKWLDGYIKEMDRQNQWHASEGLTTGSTKKAMICDVSQLDFQDIYTTTMANFKPLLDTELGRGVPAHHYMD